MEQLVPPLAHRAVTALEALADPPVAAGRPAVRVCMVQSIDGVSAIDGTSGGLGDADDRAFYLACRSLADIVLVGAETVRSEAYGPAKLTPQLVVARLDRGQSALPRIAVVTRSMRLDLTSPLFADARDRPIVLTCEAAPHDAVHAAERVADVVVAGSTDVDLPSALRLLARDGCNLIGCEGGPTINGALLRAALVDELCISVAPVVAGPGPRIAEGAFAATAFGLHKLFRAGDRMFMRLRPTPADTPDDG